MGQKVPGLATPVGLNDRRRTLALEALAAYWSVSIAPVAALPIPVTLPPAEEPLPPRLAEVRLPPWAADLAPDGVIPVPGHCVREGAGDDHLRVDWLSAAYWYLNGSAERAFEAAHGPIHSYAYKLAGWPVRMWERAWANRIALFLRRWAAREAGATEDALLGPLPEAEIFVTHDVDAVRKTWSIRVKQPVFHGFNGLRRLLAGDPKGAAAKFATALRFAFSGADYWKFDEMEEMERGARVSAVYLLYGRAPDERRGVLRLVDPAYDVLEAPVAERLRALVARGHAVGVHPSYATWEDSAAMRRERERVERATGARAVHCRQHWLRFSWTRTWAAQHAAGLEIDFTLGFNDRPGFRNGAALRFRPWDASGTSLGIESVPLVLMDSQLYDYADMDDTCRETAIGHWLGEVSAVRGCASVIWHPHTLAPDYGWRGGFAMLLRALPGARP